MRCLIYNHYPVPSTIKSFTIYTEIGTFRKLAGADRVEIEINPGLLDPNKLIFGADNKIISVKSRFYPSRYWGFPWGVGFNLSGYVTPESALHTDINQFHQLSMASLVQPWSVVKKELSEQLVPSSMTSRPLLNLSHVGDHGSSFLQIRDPDHSRQELIVPQLLERLHVIGFDYLAIIEYQHGTTIYCDRRQVWTPV